MFVDVVEPMLPIDGAIVEGGVVIVALPCRLPGTLLCGVDVPLEPGDGIVTLSFDVLEAVVLADGGPGAEGVGPAVSSCEFKMNLKSIGMTVQTMDRRSVQCLAVLRDDGKLFLIDDRLLVSGMMRSAV